MSSMFSLAGRRALVTGSTRGIGRAIAEAMIEAGAQVVISSENADDTARVADELGQTGIACDVTNDGALQALVDGTAEALWAGWTLWCAMPESPASRGRSPPSTWVIMPA